MKVVHIKQLAYFIADMYKSRAGIYEFQHKDRLQVSLMQEQHTSFFHCT